MLRCLDGFCLPNKARLHSDQVLYSDQLQCRQSSMP